MYICVRFCEKYMYLKFLQQEIVGNDFDFTFEYRYIACSKIT